ncbi:MAG TPA: class I SAM-dependent methyltransferase [Candidatus Baltobacteraceae bacterium]|nr:class I SAM-dependent methyltransferase [Candidatus Baltobacteraceae bacterium]
MIQIAAADPLAEYAARARAYVAKDSAVYGLPSSGPLFENLVTYLLNPNAHDFRLADLPGLTGDPGILAEKRSILDVGCGPGTLVWKALDLGHDATGIDLNEEKIELARSWTRAQGKPEREARVQIQDAGRLPFDSNSFDIVSSYHVLEHVSDLPSVLYEAVRVTKRGGWLELCAPDYRMSYDTHYCMAWPRFMPPQQARAWCEAMGRPATGIGTFFYVTGPQVAALLNALGVRLHAVLYREHRDSRIHNSTAQITPDPIVFRDGDAVRAFAGEIKRLQAANALPDIYKTCLEFTIVAQKL